MGAPRPPMGAAPARGPPMGAAPPMSAPPARGPQAAFHQVPARAAQPPTQQFGQMRVADGAPPPPGPPRGPPSRSGSMVSAPSQQAPKTFQGYAPAAEGGYVPTQSLVTSPFEEPPAAVRFGIDSARWWLRIDARDEKRLARTGPSLPSPKPAAADFRPGPI